MQTTVKLKCGLHVECGRHICSGTYASNVKCMYTSPPVHIVHFNQFISGIYVNIVASYVHMK